MTTNLSGSLSEFSLAEVLSLLGMGGRTARMQVTSADAVGTVHLVDGRVSSATADSARAGLLRAVVAALPVPVDDLARALQADDPVRALVESGVVDGDAAGQVASEHCTEAVGTMLEWTSGEFAVWVGSLDPSDIGVRLEVDALVGAARDRAQEWHDLRAALPASDSVLALVPEVAAAPVVDPDDWAVLARVDGRRTLAEVLAALGASPLAAGTRLVQLMGRGLVVVHASGVDAELVRATQMLDAFEAGPGEVIGLVATQEPGFARDVHDLFVTEPEAVEEWQAAGADSWVVAEPEPEVGGAPVGAVEPIALTIEPVEFAAEPTGGEVPSFDTQGEGFAIAPMAYVFDPVPDPEPDTLPHEPEVTFLDPELVAYEPEAFDVEPGVNHTEPAVEVVAPIELEVQPVSVAVAESFAWSPWAQEMGLGEALPVAAVAPDPVDEQGFADMVEDGSRQEHTATVPVPLAPVDGTEGGGEPAVEYLPMDEGDLFVPQPRDHNEGLVEAPAEVHPVGIHAAIPEPVPALDMAFGAEAGESAPDPLAGGLLAHLMSSVRGL